MHGWGDKQPELTRMSKQGQWDEMADVITDDMLDIFAVVGNPEEVGRGLGERLGPLAGRISLYANYEIDTAIWPTVAAAVRKAAG
jgi:hypothetical protein